MGWNERIIEEFRANNGKVGGVFEGAPLVVITTQGRRTNKPHTNPVIYLKDGDRYLVFASNRGSAQHPDWFHNLAKYPAVTMEIGTDEGYVKSFATRAVVIEGEERDRLYERECAIDPTFVTYQEQAPRVIPVVALYPLVLADDGERNRMIGEQLIAAHTELRATLQQVRVQIDDAIAGAPAAGVVAPPDLAEQLRRNCLTYCWGLQLHHIREDGSFSALEQRFPELVPAINRLREEHHVVSEALQRFESLLNEDVSGDPEALKRLRGELDELVSGLEEHFAYEEEHLLPSLNVTRRSVP
ncbi:nitroreductase family deazaflavin-dependent oxidoreductase [Dactylosporangium roseum]|uniref:Nitroreductase family deazaflavin-dependent oxidoreductase n=1 Tax=Dactylosporangium roseum TaxID=47989 RepID=A0ABY5ZGH5_9ACTN|nr:nitroreductase/quinone reductase family protein [Dactylosporangium roseum]UWZ39374.1 nitroreductase family deazaflavin-dependent oxidoreductase [Dactylosporangium roseum]